MCSDPVTAGVNDEQRGRILALALDYMKATQRRDDQTGKPIKHLAHHPWCPTLIAQEALK